MAGVDPYAPCPCGSGQKFKWCCHSVEPQAEKAIRLYEGGQIEAALVAFDDGLRKSPGNPWLANRKAGILIRLGRTEEAAQLLEGVVAKDPKAAGSWSLLIRAALELSGPAHAAERLQEALLAVEPEARPAFTVIAELIGIVLREVGMIPAARMHLTLAFALRGGASREENYELLSAIQSLEGTPTASPWLRNPYRLEPTPAGLAPDLAQRFDEALAMARNGLWRSAAAAFELLAGDGLAAAEMNLGLCKLWTVDFEGAAAAFRRYVRSVGDTTDAVDFESLRQQIQPPDEEELVDLVQLIWTLRDRQVLMDRLEASDRVDAEGPVPLDPDNAESATVDGFTILDRPKPTGEPSTSIDAYPRIVGRVLIGQEIALLEAFDDGRLDGLSNWLTELAGPALPPAQPKTKEIDKLSRHAVATRVLVWTPEDISEDQEVDLQEQVQRHVVEDVWTVTPSPHFQGRTPLEAARNPDAPTKVAIRAALFQFELNAQLWRKPLDLTPLRDRLGLAPEPQVDPGTDDVRVVHIARLHLIPAERLDDDELLTLYNRARGSSMLEALGRAASAIVERSELLSRQPTLRQSVYLDLANLAVTRNDQSLAVSWLRRGRESDPNARGNMMAWDLADVRVRARFDPPDQWVPELAIVLRQSETDPNSGQLVLATLAEMGLVRTVPNPDRPDEYLLDTRILQALMSEYGPRITTAQGELGISATRGGIWTPGSDARTAAPSSAGGIWTPGSNALPAGRPDDAGEKPSLIVPGR